MKQRFSNSACFGNHDATIVFAVITFFHCETIIQKIHRMFFSFINISPITFYCTVMLALTNGILADQVTIAEFLMNWLIQKIFTISDSAFLGILKSDVNMIKIILQNS